ASGLGRGCRHVGEVVRIVLSARRRNQHILEDPQRFRGSESRRGDRPARFAGEFGGRSRRRLWVRCPSDPASDQADNLGHNLRLVPPDFGLHQDSTWGVTEWTLTGMTSGRMAVSIM